MYGDVVLPLSLSIQSPFSRKNVSISIPKTKLHHYDPQEVAQELCLMDSELLRKIKPQELEGGSWMKVKVRIIVAALLGVSTLTHLGYSVRTHI